MPGGGRGLGQGAPIWLEVTGRLPSWLWPLPVLREPAEYLLMFPFAFGHGSRSVFSFSPWALAPPSC